MCVYVCVWMFLFLRTLYASYPPGHRRRHLLCKYRLQEILLQGEPALSHLPCAMEQLKNGRMAFPRRGKRRYFGDLKRETEVAPRWAGDITTLIVLPSQTKRTGAPRSADEASDRQLPICKPPTAGGLDDELSGRCSFEKIPWVRTPWSVLTSGSVHHSA